MATNGKIEREITVPTGGWDVAVTEVGGGGGPHTVTVAAGVYYLSTDSGIGSTLPAAFAAALDADANLAGDYACSISAGEGGSGKVTISATGITSFAITWTDTDFRDALGFEDGPAITGALTYTSTDSSPAVWIASCSINSPFGAGDNGADEADAAFSESPAGNVFAIYGQRKRTIWFQWELTSHAKCRIAGESVVNESFQSFWRKCILAESAFAGGKVAGPVRVHWDADSTTVYVTCKITGETLRRIQQEMAERGWTGLWDLRLDRLVEVP